MQVSVEQSGSVVSKYYGVLARSYGATLENCPMDLNRPVPWKRLIRQHPLAQDNRGTIREKDDNIKKKLLKHPDRHLYSVPVQLTRSVNRGLSSDQSVRPCPWVSDGDVDPVSHPASCSGSAGGTTGLSTEHSSVYSWRYDEFEQANAQRVRQLFSELDDLLYEGKARSTTEALQKECEEWNTHSPHLRILGTRLGPVRQEGVQYVHRQVSSPGAGLPAPYPVRSDYHGGLRVDGHGLAPGPGSDRLLGSGPPVPDPSPCGVQPEEEVYVVEGRIEEFLAYDVKEIESGGVDKQRASPRAWRPGVPPVSPGACLRDGVAGELFDDVWREVVGLLEGVLRKHWEEQHSGGATEKKIPQCSSQILCEPLSPLLSRGGTHASPSSGPNSRNVFIWANSANAQDSGVFRMNLNGVMTIRAKPLQQRQQGIGERCDSEDGNGVLLGVTAQGLRGRSAASPRRRFARPGAQTRLRLPVQSTQLLRRTRLSTVAEDLLSLSVSAVHNQRLPLIHADAPEQCISAAPPRLAQLRGRVVRVGGAMQPGSSLPPLREPAHLEAVSRPNTTLTFRSDTPMKSSFTPMDFVCNMRTGRGLLLRAGRGTPMGVTGFSMGITCSTASGFSECTTPPRKRPNHLPSTDGEGGNIPLAGAISPRKSLARFAGHGRKKCHVAMP